MKPLIRAGADCIFAVSILSFLAALIDAVARPLPPLAFWSVVVDRRIPIFLLYLILLGCAAAARFRGSRIWTAAFATAASLGVAALSAPGSHWTLAVFPLSCLTVAALHPPIAAGSWILASGAVHAVALAALGAPWLAEAVLGFTVLLAAGAVLVGRALSEWREQTQVFEQSNWAAAQYAMANVRLQDGMERNEVWTRVEERTRIAREIHDAVGYALTAALVQVKAAQEELKKDPSLLGSRLEKLEDLVRSSIRDIRDEIRGLREDGGEDWMPRFRRLCAIFSDYTGMRVNVQAEDTLRILDDGVGENLYRILQEALTNAFRHGHADFVDVAVGLHEGHLIVRVSDNGRGCEQVHTGNGMRGTRERVEAMRGEVAWQTKPERGFDVGISIPWEERTGGA